MQAIPEQHIWIPGGFMSIQESQARRAAEEYDERLTLGRHKQTGDWVIFMRRGPGEPPLPVLGFGRELPSPDTIKRRLYEADTLRHGERLLREMEAHNEAVKQPIREAASEATGEMAEAIAWAKRKFGEHPSPRIFVPRSA